MILVDIGNSGLRASQVAEGQLFRDQKVYRLSELLLSNCVSA